MSTTKVILSRPWQPEELHKEAAIGRKEPLENNRKEYVSHMSEQAALIAKEELREDDNIREQSLEQFREWIHKNRDIHNCRTDRNFLLRFLRVKKYSLPMAQQMLLKYLNLRKTFCHMLMELDFLAPPVNQLISAGYIFASPFRDKSGRRVILTLANRMDPYKFTNVDMARAHMITYEACMLDEDTQVLGFTHVGDTQNVSGALITLWSPTEIATIVKWGEQSVPMRHKEIHLLNVPTVFRYVYEFLHGRFSGKMQKRFKIHETQEELHKCVDVKVLPKEYGGEMPMAEMIDLWKEELLEKRESLLALDKMELLSSKGIISRKNNQHSSEFNKNDDMPNVCGSFRRLEVD